MWKVLIYWAGKVKECAHARTPPRLRLIQPKQEEGCLGFLGEGGKFNINYEIIGFFQNFYKHDYS